MSKIARIRGVWKKWKTIAVYPQTKCLEHKFSTKLYTISTGGWIEKWGEVENKCVFCRRLERLKSRCFFQGYRMRKKDKTDYGNRKGKKFTKNALEGEGKKS